MKRISLLLVVVLLFVAFVSCGTVQAQSNSVTPFVALKQINQQGGIMLVSPKDGKSYISFVVRVHTYRFRETLQLLTAIDDGRVLQVQGLNLDEIHITRQTLTRLLAWQELELLAVRNTALTPVDIQWFKSQRPSVTVLTEY